MQTTHDLWVDGRSTTISIAKVTPTSINLTWTLPNPRLAYNGAVVLLSEEPFSVENFPVDGTKYAPSTNWLIPLNKIGNSQVVSAFYGFFGDNIEQLTVTVDNVDTNKLYYASLHICSTVLQYFTPGVQSYPVVSNTPASQVSPYAGSILETSSAPVNPKNGQVYFDTNSSTVLIWNDDQSSWIKIDQGVVITGSVLPITKAQIFFNYGTLSFSYFDGTAFIPVTSANLRVKLGNAWAPFNSFDTSGLLPTTPITGTFAYYSDVAQFGAPKTVNFKVFTLGTWFNPSPDLVEVLIGSTWTPIAQVNMDSFGQLPAIPTIGNFFYNTATKQLMVWSGGDWVRADADQLGTPAADKINVGTDGSLEARLDVIQTVKMRLGYPTQCVELTEDQFMVAVTNALAELRKRSDSAVSLNYLSFTLKGGQSTYYLNDPRDLTHKIVNIIKIHRVNMLGVSSLSAENGLYAQTFFNQLYQGSNVDLLSIHLMNQLSETYERIFAGSIGFTWNETSRKLTLLRNMAQPFERVVLEVSMDKTEQELIYDRWTKMWIQDWTYANCLEALGLIRSKFGTLPGANGGITMNGAELLTLASEKKTELLRQINDYEIGNGGTDFGSCFFLMG